MSHIKQGLPGNYYPGRAGEFPKATRLGLACVQAAITLQREKALKATSGKFKDVWLVFQGQHGRFFLQAVAPKTAQVSRAEKKKSSLFLLKDNEFRTLMTRVPEILPIFASKKLFDHAQQ